MSDRTRTTAAVDPAQLADQALAAAKGEAVVLVSTSASANVRWAANTLTTNGFMVDRSVTVVATAPVEGGTGVGVVSRRGVTPADVADLVAEAEAAAAASPAAEDAAPLAGDVVDADWGDAAAELGPESLSSLAAALGRALDEARGGGHELFGYAQQDLSTTHLATTSGLRRRYVQPSGTVHLNGKSAGRTRSAWAGAGARMLDQVDVDALAQEVRTRLGWQERTVDIGPGRHEAVLSPAAVADLMAYAYWSADARSAHEGRSAFSKSGGGTRVGDRLTEVPLTLRSDPSYAGLECAPFVATGASSELASVFDNGLDVPGSSWIDRGVLTALPTTRHTAELTGLPFAPAADNLVLHGDETAFGGVDDMVRGMDRGLLVTCLWYIREVDPRTLLLTGLTRDGVYLVEGGEVVGAVTNFRFNESPVELLARVAAVGDTAPTLGREFGSYLPRTAMPALRVHGFNFSSVSQAS